MLADIERGGALDDYGSYGDAWLLPIVYPLGLAIIAQIAVYADLASHRLTGRGLLPNFSSPATSKGAASESSSLCGPSVPAISAPPSFDVELPLLLLMLAETLFAVFCIISCIMK